MALFGLFGKNDGDAAIRKLVNKLEQKFGPPEERQSAAERLFEMHTPAATAGLLRRFTIHVDPSIVDDEQKTWVCDALVDTGEPAVEPIRAFIKQQNIAPSWALKALEQISTPEAVVEVILEALEHVGPDYTRDPEKKITLLRHLVPSPDARIAARVVPFLEDPSEDVRIATLAVLHTRTDDLIREPIIKVLTKAVEEKSERLRRAAAEALVKTGVSVKGHRPAVEAALPPGYSVDKESKVHAKG